MACCRMCLREWTKSRGHFSIRRKQLATTELLEAVRTFLVFSTRRIRKAAKLQVSPAGGHSKPPTYLITFLLTYTRTHTCVCVRAKPIVDVAGCVKQGLQQRSDFYENRRRRTEHFSPHSATRHKKAKANLQKFESRYLINASKSSSNQSLHPKPEKHTLTSSVLELRNPHAYLDPPSTLY